MYSPGYLLIKAGVILVDLQSADLQQGELDLDDAQPDESKRDRSRLMLAMDALNGRFGEGTVGSAATGGTGPPRLWEMETGTQDPAVHDAAGGCAGGAGLSVVTVG